MVLEGNYGLFVATGKVHGDTRLDIGESVCSSRERHAVKRRCERNGARGGIGPSHKPALYTDWKRSYKGPLNQSNLVGR